MGQYLRNNINKEGENQHHNTLIRIKDLTVVFYS